MSRSPKTLQLGKTTTTDHYEKQISNPITQEQLTSFYAVNVININIPIQVMQCWFSETITKKGKLTHIFIKEILNKTFPILM